LSFLYERCTLKTYDTTIIENCDPFDCGNNDLNDFFANDALNYTSELLGKSYCFTFDDDERQIVTAFTISNDSIKTYTLPNSRKRKSTLIFLDKTNEKLPCCINWASRSE
jgi:hypothetical protein